MGMSDDQLEAAIIESERIKTYGNKEWAPAFQRLMRDSFVDGVRWAYDNPPQSDAAFPTGSVG